MVINRKDQLFSDVRGLLAERKIGLTRTAAPDEGYDVVNVLTNALWSIDGNHGTLDQASVLHLTQRETPNYRSCTVV